MSYGGPCMYCGAAVEAESAAYPVQGFELTRRGGGANRILGRERVPGKIAHKTCAELAIRERQRPGQEALL